jgi:hypothetical protein
MKAVRIPSPPKAGCTAPTHERIVDIVRRAERGEASPRPELLLDI